MDNIQLKKGILDICVLYILKREKSYGYKIIDDFNLIFPNIEISESSLYPILKRLVKSNCCTIHSEEHNGRLRHYYQITAEGVDHIKNFIQDWNIINNAVNLIKEDFKS